MRALLNKAIKTGRIGRQLLVALILFSSFITIFTSAYQLYVDYRVDIDQVHNQFHQIEHSHIKPLAESVWAFNEEMIMVQINALVDLPAVERLEVVVDGQIRWDIGITPDGNTLTKEFPLVHQANNKTLNLGSVRVLASFKEIYQKLLNKVWVILLTNAIKTFLVALFVFFLFHFLVTRHLLHIAEFANTLDISKSFTSLKLLRKRKSGQEDELDVLVRALNDRTLSLKNNHDYLEDVVKERTLELSAANEDLKESESKYRGLSDAAFEGILLIDKGNIIDANNTIAAMFGYSSPKEIVGISAIDIIRPEDREEVQNKILSGNEEPYEISGLKKDGSSFPIEAHGKMFPYKGKQIRVTAIRDLTEKKKAEEEIKTLQGILPICSICKNIRNDEGYYEQIEAYIHKHTGVDFSHTICNPCMKEHYPEEYEKIVLKKKG